LLRGLVARASCPCSFVSSRTRSGPSGRGRSRITGRMPATRKGETPSPRACATPSDPRGSQERSCTRKAGAREERQHLTARREFGAFRTSPTHEGMQAGLVQGEALLTCREGNHVRDHCHHVMGVMRFEDTKQRSAPGLRNGGLVRPPSAAFHHMGEVRSTRSQVESSKLGRSHVNPPSHLREPNGRPAKPLVASLAVITGRR
jgi:hypothetical protein